MGTRWLLIVTALVEGGAGVALLAVPSGVVEMLLGVELYAGSGFVLGRILGAALVGLAVACGPAGDGGRGRPVGLLGGLLVYNVAVPVLLLSAAVGAPRQGVALWPACALHATLAVWCVACLVRR
jgi:hypothetical protein